MRKERMIREYIKAITGIEVDVEIIDDIPVLSQDGLYHLYLLYDRIRFIGVCEDDIIDFISAIAANRRSILDLYKKISD